MICFGLFSILVSAVAVAAGPPRPTALSARVSLNEPPQSPTSCDTIYDGNLGQGEREFYTDSLACFNVLRPDGFVWDLLVADDFIAGGPGHITDAFLYVSMTYPGRFPTDGVRIHLWGRGDAPAEEQTGVWDVPPEQVRFWSLSWQEPIGYEIQATGLNIPYEAGRNWITIQPRDRSPGAKSYFVLRNNTQPLQGMDAFVKDGPESELPGYGFGEWRSAGSSGLGFAPADSYIRLETCDAAGAFTIAMQGDCGSTVDFSWQNAPAEEDLLCVYARETGAFTVPSGFGCYGTVLGLGSRGIRLAFQISTGSGSGAVNGNLRAAACPGYFQAVIGGAGPCQVSNVISTP